MTSNDDDDKVVDIFKNTDFKYDASLYPDIEKSFRAFDDFCERLKDIGDIGPDAAVGYLFGASAFVHAMKIKENKDGLVVINALDILETIRKLNKLISLYTWEGEEDA